MGVSRPRRTETLFESWVEHGEAGRPDVCVNQAWRQQKESLIIAALANPGESGLSSWASIQASVHSSMSAVAGSQECVRRDGRIRFSAAAIRLNTFLGPRSPSPTPSAWHASRQSICMLLPTGSCCTNYSKRLSYFDTLLPYRVFLESRGLRKSPPLGKSAHGSL